MNVVLLILLGYIVCGCIVGIFLHCLSLAEDEFYQVEDGESVFGIIFVFATFWPVSVLLFLIYFVYQFGWLDNLSAAIRRRRDALVKFISRHIISHYTGYKK